MSCLDDNRVLAYVDGGLSPGERGAIEHHLDGCPACRRLISDVVRGTGALHQLPPGTVERIGVALSSTCRPDVRPRTVDGARLPTIPTAAGDLEVLGVIGQGGMGQVALARQLSLGREVAVKSLLPHCSSPAAEAALLLEGRCAGGLEHPNIVPIHALGRDQDGGVVLMMKRIEGTSWRARIHEELLERNLEILIQVCNAVHFAHTRGVLHRDIKPDNVMLGEFGEVTLVDWGVALRLSEREGATEVAGTPRYLAPEMLRGGPELSARTDVYLLGATLHEILLGRPPHGGETLRAVLSSVASAEAPVVDADGRVPEGLARICRRALDPTPEGRHSTAAELRDELVGFLRHRASDRLAEEAMTRLTEARAAESPALRRRSLIEGQFGLRQALREWAENQTARRGLAVCLADLARLEIAEGNRGAAELLIAELGEPPADVAAALAALRERQAEEAAGRARLAAIERDRDFGVSRRERVLLAAGALTLNLLSILFAELTRTSRALRPADMIRETSIMALAILVLTALARRHLFRNLVNRQVILSVLIAIFVILFHETLTLWRPQPVEETLAEAMVLTGLTAALIALLLVRWFWLIAAITFAAAAVATARPQLTFYLWGMVTSLPFLGMMIGWWRSPKGSERLAPSPGDEPRG